MYKNIIVSLLMMSSVVIRTEANNQELLQDISKVKSEIKGLQSSLKQLESKLPPNNQLITHTEVGYINTKGNTKTDTFSIDANAKKPFGKHIVELSIDAQYAKDSDIESKNRYFVELEYSYEIKNKFSLNIINGYKKDKFSSFAYQFYSGPGSKYKAYKTNTQELTLEGNILYAVDSLEDTRYAADGLAIKYPNSANTATHSVVKGSTNNYASYRVKAVYIWNILEGFKFNQEFSYRSDFDDSENYFAFSKTAFTSKLLGMFSAGISYKVDYTNLPSSDKGHKDTALSANIIIDY